MSTETRKISKRELTIAYQIDNKSVQELSTEFGVTPDEMKATIRTAGLVVRKSEIKNQPQTPAYTVVLVDGETETSVVCRA